MTILELTNREQSILALEYATGNEYMPENYSLVDYRHWVNSMMLSEKQFAKTDYGLKHVKRVTGQPYTDFDSMYIRVKSEKTLYISTDYNDSPLWGIEGNLEFRTMHDLQHIRAVDTHGQCNFSLSGEACAYSMAAEYTPSEELRRILFSEIVMQAAYFYQYGGFAQQKVVMSPTADKIRKRIEKYYLDEE